MIKLNSSNFSREQALKGSGFFSSILSRVVNIFLMFIGPAKKSKVCLLRDLNALHELP